MQSSNVARAIDARGIGARARRAPLNLRLTIHRNTAAPLMKWVHSLAGFSHDKRKAELEGEKERERERVSAAKSRQQS